MSFLLGAKKKHTKKTPTTTTNEIQKVLNKGNTGYESKGEKWNGDLKEEVPWDTYEYEATPEPKLRWFQPRILYRIIPTYKYLFM